MNTSKIFGDAFVSSIRLFLAILRGIILIPIITRLIGEAAYGTWVVLLAIISITTGIGGFHLYGALIRYTPQEKLEGQTLIDTLVLALGLAILVSALLILVELIFEVLPNAAQDNIAITAVTLLLSSQIILSVFKNYPRALNRVKEYELVEISQLLLEVIFLSLVFWQYQSIIIGLWALVVVSVVLNIILGILYLPREIRRPKIYSFDQYLRYSAPMVPKSMGTKILTNADRYLLNIFISPTAVAVYAITYSVAMLLRNITTPLNSTLYPSVTQAWEEGDFASLQQLYRKIFRGYTILGIPAVVGLSLLAEPILLLISTEQIAIRGKYLLPALAFGFFIRGYDNPIAYVFNAAEENGKLAIITVIAAVGNVVLNVILIPSMGVFGAVIATLLSQFIITGYLYMKVQSKIDVHLPKITLGRSIIATLIMAALLIFHPFQLQDVSKLILYPILGILIYIPTLIALGEFSFNEVKTGVYQVKQVLTSIIWIPILGE